MIKISKASHRSIDDFGTKEWHGVDMEHYGKAVEWNNKQFRFKATQDGRVIGYVDGKHESGVIYIETIIVGKSHRGTGVGKLLMNKAEEFGKQQNAHKVHLITGKSWNAAKFYESLGYKHITDLPDHHFHTTFVIYEKSL